MSDPKAEARALLARALELEPDAIDGEASIWTVPAWDSLGHLRVVEELESRIGGELEPDAIVGIENLDDVAAILGRHAGAA